MPAHDPREIDPELIAQAAEILAAGGLVAFPTDTVYGLGADALSAAANERLFAAKGRPPDRPVPVLLADRDDADAVAHLDSDAKLLADAFWPGPLTLVLRALDAVPLTVTAGTGTVGVRVPDHPVPRALARALGRPVTGSSANSSGASSHTTAAGVETDLGDTVDMVLRGECGPHSLASSVVDCSGERMELLRAGALSVESLRTVVPSLQVSRTVTAAVESRS